MVKKKRQSKRLSLKDKYKVEKKVKEHHRKQRREQRKRARDGVTLNKSKKDPGLPNLMPYKEKFLRQMLDDTEREKAREKERVLWLNKQRAARDAEAMEEDYDGDKAHEAPDSSKKRKRSGPSAEDLASAASRVADFEERKAEKEAEAEEAAGDVTKGKKRMYMKELRNVVDAADVVLLVLDARDPQSCRAPQAEKMVLENARTKRLVLVLNKIDLVPKAVAEQWLTELRKEFPTVAFRASTQQQRSNLGRAQKDSIGLGTASAATGATVGDSICVGADTLLQLLKNYSRNRNIKSSITVGVVGYPNVGKSSVINSLKRSRAVGVSPTAGFTKTLQYVQLDKKVQLIDSPGVLFQDSGKGDRLAVRNCLAPAELADARGPVLKLLEKCRMEQLMMIYSLPRCKTGTEFLVELARSRGKLGKGGVPNQDVAARMVLQDWNSGKIPYYVTPPKSASKATRVTSVVVGEWAKEFDLEALMAKEKSELVEGAPEDPDNFAAVFSGSLAL